MVALGRTQQLELAHRHRLLVARTVTRTTESVHQAWATLGSWDRADIPRFRAGAEPAVKAGKVTAVRAASAYVATVTGRPAQVIRPELIEVEFDAESPFFHQWRALADGADWDTAHLVGRAIAARSVMDLVVASSRGSVRLATTGRQPTGWQRVLGAGSCTWCEEAAGQVYKSAESADFGHTGCSCTIVPVFE